MASVILTGLVLALTRTIGASRPDPQPAAAATSRAATSSGEARRDAAAASPMLAVPQSAATSGARATPTREPMLIPPSTNAGRTRVPSGFPHTPEGAVAQLAAIETAVLAEMDHERTREIHQAWTVPGAVGFEQWRMTKHVDAFRASADRHATKPSRIGVVPAGAQVKAQDGPDWVLACVLVTFSVTIHTQAQMAYGHCERMQWQPGSQRWLIGPGEAPAEAPSTWPGTDLYNAAGWRPWAQPVR